MATTVNLIHGDCVALMSEGLRDGGRVLRADASITDPPYNVALDGDRDWDDFSGGRWVDSDREFLKFTASWARPLLTEVLWPGSLIAAFSAHRTVHAVMFGLQDAGFDLIDIAIWLYATGQVKHRQKLKPAYEPITIARRRSPQGDSPTGLNKLFKEKGRGLIHTQELKAEEGNRHPLNVDIADPAVLELDDKDINDMAKFLYVAKPSAKEIDYGCEALPERRKEGNLGGETLHQTRGEDGELIRGKHTLRRNYHPTVKPIDLMRRLVRMLTKPGATVVDPFMGSGTTGIACVLEGRNFIGVEREQDFHTIARFRIAQALRDTGQEDAATALCPPDLTIEARAKEGNLSDGSLSPAHAA